MMEAPCLPQHARKLLERIATENGIDNPRFELAKGSEQGDNYAGVILRIAVLGAKNGSDVQLNLIMKSPPPNAKRRELYRTKRIFKSEIAMYDEVFPELTRLLKAKGLVSEDQVVFPGTARAYATHQSEDGAEDAIIMEDLGASGYVMGDRLVGADAELCRVALRALARLHAASLVLQLEDPQRHHQLATSLEEMFSVPEWEKGFSIMAKRAIPMVAERFPEGTEGRTKFEAFVENFIPILRKVTEPNEELSVICHGDTWINNVLYKCEKDSTIPADVCLIDLQLSRYATPVCDISYFLFCSTTKAMRDQHLTQLLQDYHTFLCDFLKALGCPNEKIITWDGMQDQYRRYMKFGLCMAALTIPLFMSKSGDIKGVEDDVDGATSFHEYLIDESGDNPAANERLSDVLQDMLELGYL